MCKRASNINKGLVTATKLHLLSHPVIPHHCEGSEKNSCCRSWVSLRWAAAPCTQVLAVPLLSTTAFLHWKNVNKRRAKWFGISTPKNTHSQTQEEIEERILDLGRGLRVLRSEESVTHLGSCFGFSVMISSYSSRLLLHAIPWSKVSLEIP